MEVCFYFIKMHDPWEEFCGNFLKIFFEDFYPIWQYRMTQNWKENHFQKINSSTKNPHKIVHNDIKQYLARFISAVKKMPAQKNFFYFLNQIYAKIKYYKNEIISAFLEI